MTARSLESHSAARLATLPALVLAGSLTPSRRCDLRFLVAAFLVPTTNQPTSQKLEAALTCFAAFAPSGRMGLSWSLVGPAVWLSACRIRIIRLQKRKLRCVSGAMLTISTAARLLSYRTGS